MRKVRTSWSAGDVLQSSGEPRRSLADFGRRTLRHAPVAVLIFVLAAVGLLGASRLLSPFYESTVRFALTPPLAAVGQTGPPLSSARVDAEVAALNSDAFTQMLIGELGRAGGPSGALADGSTERLVQARREGELRQVRLTARGDTASEAFETAKVAVELYRSRQLELFVEPGDGRENATAARLAEARAALVDLETEREAVLASDRARPRAPRGAPIPSAGQRELDTATRLLAATRTLLESEVLSGDIARVRTSGVFEEAGPLGQRLAVEVAAREQAEAATAGDVDARERSKYRVLTAASAVAAELDASVARLRAETSLADGPSPEPAPVIASGARLQSLDVRIAIAREALDGAMGAGRIDAEPRRSLGVSLVSGPSPGATPLPMRSVLIVPGVIALALALAIAYAATMAAIDDRIGDVRDVAALIGAPVLALTPRIAGRDLRRLPPEERHPANVATENPASPFANALRDILSSIRSQDSSPVTLAITGAQPGDGATTIALALSRMAASEGLRVLLIDGDVESAGLTRIMDLEPEVGVDVLLDGGHRWADLIVQDDVTSVHVLPAMPGKARTSGLSLAQLTAFRAAVTEASRMYDITVIDCQSPCSRSRFRSLLRNSDLAIVVASYGLTRRSLLGAVGRRIEQGGSRVIGVVLNLAPRAARLASAPRTPRSASRAPLTFAPPAQAHGAARPSLH